MPKEKPSILAFLENAIVFCKNRNKTSHDVKKKEKKKKRKSTPLTDKT